MNKMVNLKINGQDVSVPEGSTILDAAREVGINIPTLCYLKDINEIGACRMCLVEVKGARGLQAACVYPVTEGLEVFTNSEKARKARRMTLELILSNHEKKCLTCIRNKNCELQNLAEELGVDTLSFEGENIHHEIDNESTSLIRDNNKCVLCRRCIGACDNQQISVISCLNRGFATEVGAAFNQSMADVGCIYCGQCIVSCPVGALYEKSSIPQVQNAIDTEGKHVVVQTAPAVRAALGEEFGLPIGTPVTGKMVAALKRLGFHKVYDTNFAADLTIMEEGTELLGRIKNGGVLPMITSCSPGWVNYAEYNYGDLLDHLSSCKSPHQMQGAIIKSYYADRNGIDPKDIFVVSIMPCTAKKGEKEREEMHVDGIKDVDAVLTTRELARMIKRAGILFNRLPDEEFDQDLMGEYTGAGVIFGVTGGVMEAALRTVYYVLTGKEHEAIKFEAVRGFDGIREASLDINGTVVNVAIAHGMKNAKVLLDDIRAGKSKYHFIEIMGCPGGCIAGGGQPYVRSCFLPNEADDIMDTYKEKRAKALYSEDERQVLRQSHNNPQIKALYDEFLGEPNSHKAHELLHTTYSAKVGFND